MPEVKYRVFYKILNSIHPILKTEHPVSPLDAFHSPIAFLSQQANRAILSSPPKMYLKDIEEDRLKAQMVPIDELLWDISNYKKFLNERRKLLVNTINFFLKNDPIYGEIYNKYKQTDNPVKRIMAKNSLEQIGEEKPLDRDALLLIQIML